MQIKTPKCPRCGSDKVKVTAKNPQYAELGRVPKTPDEEPISWTMGFKCECGLGFTEHVINERTKGRAESGIAGKSPRTTLNLLTREGALAVTFPMNLTEAQYAKLYECVVDSQTRHELKECIAMITNEWGIKAIIDER